LKGSEGAISTAKKKPTAATNSDLAVKGRGARTSARLVAYNADRTQIYQGCRGENLRGKKGRLN